MSSPVGLQAGCDSSNAGVLVTFLAPVPSGRITKTSSLPWRLDMKAIHLPSGDQAAH